MKKLRRYAAVLAATALLVSCAGTEDDGEDAAAEEGTESAEETEEPEAPAEEGGDAEGSEGEGAEGEEAAGEWEPEWVDGQLQPLPDGFPDREMTIVIADPPGSEEALIVNALADALSEASPVPIRLEAREDFVAIPTWEALAYVKRDADGAEGYKTVIYSSPGSTTDVVGAPVEETTGMTHDDVSYIASIEERPYFMTQCTEVEWEPTVEALVEYTKEHPGEVRFAAQGAGAATDLAFMHYMATLGAGEFESIVVGSTEDTSSATAACETDVTITSVGVILPHVQAERLDVLMVTRDKTIEEFPDAPTAADLGFEDDIMGGTRMIVTGADVDPQRLAWLHELYSYGISQDSFVETREAQPSITVVELTPEEMETADDSALEIVDGLLRDLGLHIEQIGG